MADAGAEARTASGTIRIGEARRELVLAGITVVALSRLADGPAVWILAVLLVGALLLGTLQVLSDVDGSPDAPGVPIESLLTPAVAGLACLGAIRLVPIGLALVPALGAATILLDRTIGTEARIIAARHGPTDTDRTRILVQALVVAFLAFLGTAALVPGGLPEPGGPGGAPMSELDLVVLAGVDGLVAALLGYRVSALRVPSLWSALWSAATYAGAIAIAAAALRATEIPRLIGPAMLTLVFFLWDAFHGVPPARRRDPRWIWQTVLLVALGVVVFVWNLGLR